jgi:hypothetical protein
MFKFSSKLEFTREFEFENNKFILLYKNDTDADISIVPQTEEALIFIKDEINNANVIAFAKTLVQVKK